MNSKVKGLIKAIVVYSLLIIVGTSAGYGIVLGYNKLNEPKIVLVGDYGEHFKNTDKKVVMYGTDWCPVCKRTRDFFAKEGIEYKSLIQKKTALHFRCIVN
ncbi:glutaredoxin family protein [Shewanella piezotolerans]|nr:glutaredoxin domain-containing protein [Shewanella piezotolerans]